ncbi:MAG TPA: papain-like cysteine protease family protein [Anaerolineales bacterium]
MTMKKDTFSPTTLRVLGLICILGLLLASFTQAFAPPSISQLKGEPINLQVPVLKQLLSTSCGEGVIAMTYNYMHPDTPITEAEVISYAKTNEYYTANKSPFTSPANMVKIAQYYANNISRGRVITSGQGLALLSDKLRNGEPVIIDVLSNFHDPESEAHFVVVTGISVDSNRYDAIVIHYNDPLSGTKKASDWAGMEGVWNAWSTNNDPGGPGWWLVISHP